MSDDALFEELKDEFHPPLSPTLIATLLLDYDPEDKGSLGLIKTSLRLLADETPEAEPYFYPSSDEGDDPVDSDDVRRMLASWSLESSTTTTSASGGAAADSWPSGSGSNSSDSASLNGVTSSREDNLEFLKMLFPYALIESLEQALDDCPGSDMTPVVEQILSMEAIREAEEAGGWDDDPSAAAMAEVWASLSQAERDQLWEHGPDEDDANDRAAAEAKLGDHLWEHGLSDDLVESQPMSRASSVTSKKSKAKSKKAGVQKTLVGGLPTGVLSRPAPSPASSTRSLGGAAMAKTNSKTGSNAWVAMSSIATSLAGILGPSTGKASASHFNAYLHSSAQASTYANVVASLIALDRPKPALEADYLMMLVFSDTTPDKRQVEVLGVVWTASAGEVDTALNLWALLENVKQRSGDPGPLNDGLFIPSAVPTKMAVKPSPLRTPPTSAPSSPVPRNKPLARPVVSTHLHPTSRNLPSHPAPTLVPLPPSPVVPAAKLRGGFQIPGGRAQRTKFAPSGKPIVFHPLADSIPAYKGGGVAVARQLEANATTSKKGGWLALKEREARERRLRDEALRSASRYFSSGTATNFGKTIAAHYAEQARKHNEASRELGLEAAKEQIYSSTRTTATGIDLHGLNLYQATHVVDESVEAWWEDTSLRSSPFTIITGRGLHSDQARAVLRPAISKRLKTQGWRVSEGSEGALKVFGRV